MSDRLPSGVLVSAMLRRVNDGGGFGVVLARGDDQAGAILVLAVERGGPARFVERGIGPDGRAGLVNAGPVGADRAVLDTYWHKRRAGDPDLWVIELDVVNAERFAAETIGDG
ncbi:MAG: DUF1491 family protein [Pseudomonadota bacterium]|nr:DUF1491 family protein [Pseudomonadota bacterium]